MSLSKQQVNEALNIHEAYWDYYLKGDVLAMEPLLDENYTQVGSAEVEVFSNKADAIQFLHDTINQVAGNLEMRYRNTEIESLEDMILVHERCDIYVRTDDKWIFYAKFRASSLMQVKIGGWRIIHQHSSFPDARTSDGENVAIDKITLENEQLREAIKRRTIELEHQNRSLEIEASLERVRSKTMAMQHSDELRTVVLTIYEQLKLLKFNAQACNIVIANRDTGDREFWVSGFTQNLYPESYKVPYINHPYVDVQLKAWKEDVRYAVFEYSGEMKKDFDKIFFTETDFKNVPDDAKKMMMETPSVTFSTAFLCHGCIQALGDKPLTKENEDILIRFAKVFEQTYTRFLDLQKAEGQTKEAQIELALERVRARTMAMQKSDELPEAASLLFQQIQSLGMPAWSAGYCIWNDDEKSAITLWMSSEGVLQPPFSAPTNKDELFIEMRKGQENGKPFHVVEMGGEKLVQHYQYMRTLPVVGEILDSIIEAGHPLPTFQIMHHAYFSKGFLLFITYEPVPFAHDIFKRFANVFEQTYIRFLDLQKAETQAREAQIEVALERVRSRALAMQNPNELIEIANVMREQMGLLGQSELETTAVHLYSGGAESFESWYAFRDGNQNTGKVVVGSTQFLIDSCELIREMVSSYYSKMNDYTLEASGAKLNEFANVLMAAIPEIKESPAKAYYHFSDFSGGSLLMVSYQPPHEESKLLIKKCASVFDLAYRRYLDLKLAEEHAEQAKINLIQIQAEKKKAEDALIQLKSTQAQLVQSEKLASLGELTAGIAHEIQNPLNFVNNFSEVSTELIDEMKDELSKGNLTDVNNIADDLKDNLSKINQHGQRASSIVKGMLEHSRKSTGEKSLIDINALCDEYLRLAFHGYRAKDRSFNADFEMIADASLPKTNVVSQDLGRVLLNLINNAFYAVNDKALREIENRKLEMENSNLQPSSSNLSYKPKVTVITQLIANSSVLTANPSILISIKDNGNGIPQENIDKIFQPFFTTKPTGQGTGLGLSLAYDIVKAHGGEMKVESKEGVGTEFKIEIPIK
jgi:signal transduction histidine kinase/ketosteroid isomerase-like protein